MLEPKDLDSVLEEIVFCNPTDPLIQITRGPWSGGHFHGHNYLKPYFSPICRSSSSQVMLGPSARERIPSSMARSSSSVQESSESSCSRSLIFSSVVSFGNSSSISSKLIDTSLYPRPDVMRVGC